jgi:hypothetical protein
MLFSILKLKPLLVSIIYLSFIRFGVILGQLPDIKLNEKPAFEKLYLHFDRDRYEAGGDIWFKAYLVDATTNKPITYESCLNVELYSSENKLILKEVIELNNGIGKGDFSLDNNLVTGTYFIRGYTNWMRNFGELFFYTKEIEIDNPYIKKSDGKGRINTSSMKVDVQFMPESGSLIEDVLSDVGFKATDENGHGCDTKGVIFSTSNDTVVSFNSSHLGMGWFSFIPKQGFSYYALGTTEGGSRFNVLLPTVKEIGYNLHVTEYNDSYFKVVLQTNLETLKKEANKMMFLSCVTRNILYLVQKIIADTTINTVFISKKNFPEGITRITLYDCNFIAQCERLFYVHKKECIYLKVTSDKGEYCPKEKTDLIISIKDSVSNDIAATLSMAVTEINKKLDNRNNSNICTSFLLESDIRGKIEQQSYYFDVKQPDRFSSLNLLLLTQGWRNYIWKQLPDSITHIDFPIETGIAITGKLNQILLNKAIPNATITLALLDSVNKPIFQFTNTDNEGRFSFKGLSFIGQRELIVSAMDVKNKQKGLIQLDPLYLEPAAFTNTFSNELKQQIPALLKESENEMVSERGQMKPNRRKKFTIRDTIPIDQVEIHAKKSLLPVDGRYRIYGGIPDHVIESKDIKGYTNMDDFLQRASIGGGFRVKGRGGCAVIPPEIDLISTRSPTSINGQTAKRMVILLDGMEITADILCSLEPTVIDKIEVLTHTLIFGMNVAGAISIFTKKGSSLSKESPSSIVKKEIEGYYQSREFYCPVFDGKDISDPRTETVFWKPDIVTDSSGKANISYYNKLNTAEIHVQVEGLTKDGVPLVGIANYRIK